MSEDEFWASESPAQWPWGVRRHQHLWRPPTDVYETDEAYVVMVEVAGMRESQFSVTLDRQVLSIRGVRSDSPRAHAYHHMEINYGEFATDVRLATAIDASQIQATYSDGFLRVVLPKKPPTQIPITD
jgi:HSP20 family protein